MRTSSLAGVVLSLVGLLLTVITALAAIHLETRPGPTRSTPQTTDVHVDLTSLHHGLLSWDAAYESPADPLAVWQTLPGLANMELADGARSSDPCLKLWQVEQFHLVGRTTTVKLCHARTGTRLYVNQRFYLRPLTGRSQ